MTSLQQYTKFDRTAGRHIRYVRLTIPNDLRQNNSNYPPGKRVKDAFFDQIPDKTLTHSECMRKLDKNPISDKKFKSMQVQTHASCKNSQFEKVTNFCQLPKCTKTTTALLKKEKRAREETNSFTNPNLTNFISGDGRVRLPDKRKKAKEVGEQRNIDVETWKTNRNVELELRKHMETWRTNRNAELQKRKLLNKREMKSARILMEQEKLQRQHQCRIEYELWLEKKRRISLAKKIDAQERMMKTEEERLLRTQQNLKAYETWLNVAKNKFKKKKQINQ